VENDTVRFGGNDPAYDSVGIRICTDDYAGYRRPGIYRRLSADLEYIRESGLPDLQRNSESGPGAGWQLGENRHHWCGRCRRSGKGKYGRLIWNSFGCRRHAESDRHGRRFSYRDGSKDLSYRGYSFAHDLYVLRTGNVHTCRIYGRMRCRYGQLHLMVQYRRRSGKCGDKRRYHLACTDPSGLCRPNENSIRRFWPAGHRPGWKSGFCFLSYVHSEFGRLLLWRWSYTQSDGHAEPEYWRFA